MRIRDHSLGERKWSSWATDRPKNVLRRPSPAATSSTASSSPAPHFSSATKPQYCYPKTPSTATEDRRPRALERQHLGSSKRCTRDARRRVRKAHRQRYWHTGDIYELVDVGGGISGIGAAIFIQKYKGGRALVIDYPIFGGEAKRNEFLVDGQPHNGGCCSAICPCSENR